MATALRSAGYRTALFGKYLNGFEGFPDDLYVPAGWSEWFGVVAGNGYSNYGYTLNEGGTLVEYGTEEDDYLTDVLAGHARAVVLRALSLGQPFFLYFAPYVPHTPAEPAPRHAGLFPDAIAPRTPSFNEADVSDKPALVAGLDPLTPPEIGADRRAVPQSPALAPGRRRGARGADRAPRRARPARLDLLPVHHRQRLPHGQHRLPPTSSSPTRRTSSARSSSAAPASPPAARSRCRRTRPTSPRRCSSSRASPELELDGRSLVSLWGSAPPAEWRATQLLEQYPLATNDDPTASRLNLERDASPWVGEPEPFYLGLRTDELKSVEWSTGERELYFLRADPYELDNRAACASPALLAATAGAHRRPPRLRRRQLPPARAPHPPPLRRLRLRRHAGLVGGRPLSGARAC